jgi:hypothetical protein
MIDSQSFYCSYMAFKMFKRVSLGCSSTFKVVKRLSTRKWFAKTKSFDPQLSQAKIGRLGSYSQHFIFFVTYE